MQINFEDHEQVLKLFIVVKNSMVDSDDHELRMVYSQLKHHIDDQRAEIQNRINRKYHSIGELQTQIEAERLNIIELETEKTRWEIKEQDNGKIG